MKNVLNIFILINVLLFSSLISYASHVPGGNITYSCIGNNQFEVTLTLYEDCTNAFESSGNITIDAFSDCGHNLTLSLANTMYKQNISQLCPSSMGQSSCNGGSLPGVYMHQWKGIITLPAQCDSWTFDYSNCCRNTSSNIAGASSYDYYFYATLNNQTSPCNSSPIITAPPIPYYCVNQPVCYSLGIIEPDGDSLHYSLVSALDDAGVLVNYQAGYSGSAPITGITIDAATGLINFIPTMQGNFVVVIQVDEYVNGVLVGSIIQDFTFQITNCSNQIISCNNSNISNVSGSVTQVNATTLEMCEGVPFSFDLTFTDPNINDSLFIISNIANVLPGSVVTYSYPNAPNTSVMSMNVSWIPPPGSSNTNNAFTVTVKDNACPVSGQQTLVYTIDVIGSTYAGLDLTICKGDTVGITASNGSVFNWFSLSGDPIIVGTNFSCDNCASTQVNPSVTTVYEVVSDLSGNCVNRDTITVNVAPNFTYTLNQSSNSSCLAEDVQLEVVPTPAAAYTYTWSPSTNLNNATIPNPILTPGTPGTYQYAVEVTSPLGCIKYDTIEINVVSEYAPDLSLSTQNLPVLDCNDSIVFNLHLGGGIPSVCGPSANANCSGGSTQTMGVQTGQNTSTDYPAPFGNWYRTAKHQFLYKAAELQAMGFTGGKINKIAFQVTNLNGSTTNYNDYSVRMGCTGATALSTWQTGLTQVFGPQNLSIATGWNDLQFSTGYEWDGISNIVIEICFNNLSGSYSYNAATPNQTTSYNSTIYYRSDATIACPYTGSPTTSNKRPITRFSFCPTTPDPSAFTYDWKVNGTSQAVAQYNTPLRFYDLPRTATDYQLIVTNIAGGCADSIDFHVEFECLRPLVTVLGPTCSTASDGTITVGADGNDGPPWIIDLLDNTGTVISTVPNVTTTTVFNNVVAGQYTIRVTDTVGLQADTTIVIAIPSPVVLTVANDTIICIGGTANLYGEVSGGNGVNSYVFNWSGGVTGTSNNETVNPLLNTTYDVYVLDSLSCSSDTLAITVNLFAPIVVATNGTDTVCPGDVSTITVIANGGHGGVYFYDWFDENGAAIGSGSNLNVTPTKSPTTYYVHVTDDCETPMEIDSVIVHWYTEPQVDFDANKYDGCFPILVNFNNLTPVSQVGTLTWDFGDGSTAANNSNPAHVYTAPGVFDVNLTVVSPDGCTSDTTIVAFITTYDYPTANFSAFPNPANIFESTVAFTNGSSNDVVTYEWFFRDSTLLGTSSLENPIFQFSTQVPFVYPVELIVTNQYGCKDSITVDVIVNGVYSFYVPTAFTPNDDLINDVFLPKGEGVDNVNYSIQIFNRDGMVVFSETDMNIPWDGTHRGEKVKDDVYIWKINTKDKFTGEEHEYYGYVAVIK